MDFVRWNDNHVPCEVCRRLYAKREGSPEPPCDDCQVILTTSNQDIAEIFLTIRNQVLLTAGGEIVGLNLSAVYPLLDVYEIVDKKRAIILIQRVFNKLQEERNVLAKVTA